MLPLFFSGSVFAEAPVVDLTATPKQAVSSYSAKPLSIEQRLQLLERKMDNDALIEVYQRLDALQAEVQELRGIAEEQAHGVEGVKQRQRNIYNDLDQRISALQQSVKTLSEAAPAAANMPSAISPYSGGSAKPGLTPSMGTIAPMLATQGSSVVMTDSAVASETPMAGEVPVISSDAGMAATQSAAVISPPAVPQSSTELNTTASVVSPLQEQEDYQKALDLLMAGSYDGAADAFVVFLTQYPDGEYRMNAQYWLGEAYYVTHRYDQAVESFGQVINDQGARKRPDAMLKYGYSLYELKRWSESREILQQLIAEYPQTTASTLAEQRLQMLRAADL